MVLLTIPIAVYVLANNKMSMPNSISITSEPSPAKNQYQIGRSVMAEEKASHPRPREWSFMTDDGTPSNFQKTIAELVGTYILIFGGCGAALTNDVQRLSIVGIAIVWGVVLMAAIYAVGHISGAHFNPAVTIAFACVRKLPLILVPLYVLAQVVGATLASLTLKLLFDDLSDIKATTTGFSDPTSLLEALVFEFIITFFLMFTICGVATDHRANKDFAGVAIGGTLLFNVMVAGPITGASMNPARSLGPAIASGIYKNIWVFIIAPILGATAAALVYALLRLPEPPKPEEKSDTKGMYI